MPQDGMLTESEVRRYGALGGECPTELAGKVIGRLYDLLREAENKQQGSCACQGKP